MLQRDYREMLVALSDQNAEFLIIGAYALAAHGLVRATEDFDIWVRPTSENATRVWAALKTYGAPLFDLKVDDLAQPGIVFQIGLRPLRIDLLTGISGIDDFELAWSSGREVDLDGLIVRVLSRNDLIVNKRASGRSKDLRDVEWLEEESDD